MEIYYIPDLNCYFKTIPNTIFNNTIEGIILEITEIKNKRITCSYIKRININLLTSQNIISVDNKKYNLLLELFEI